MDSKYKYIKYVLRFSAFSGTYAVDCFCPSALTVTTKLKTCCCEAFLYTGNSCRSTS